MFFLLFGNKLLQPYTINSAKVIFLNQRAQSRSCKGSANSCYTCDRILQDPFHFCSLSCKVKSLYLIPLLLFKIRSISYFISPVNINEYRSTTWFTKARIFHESCTNSTTRIFPSLNSKT